MTPDYRAMCAELVELSAPVDSISRLAWRLQQLDRLANRARALLAEADGPAVPDGREPASVALQPSDKELLATFNQAVADFPPRHPEAKVMNVVEYSLALELRKARAVLDRWGRPALAEQPVEPTDEELNQLLTEIDQGDEALSWRAFARAVLARWGRPAAAPVPLSERLPGSEDCDAEGRCWMLGKIEGDWRLVSTINPGIPKLKYCFSHWLPANALPLPTPEETK